MDRPRLISSGIVLLATLDLLSALSVNGFGAPGAAAPAASSRSPGQLLLVRHGESQWNRERRFTGWVDVPLTEQGEWDAASTAQVLLEEYPRSIDVTYTSTLQRCTATSRIILDALRAAGCGEIPCTERWRLNERHYGALTGQNKMEAVATMDRAELQKIRLTFDGLPAPMGPDHPHNTRSDPKFAAGSTGSAGDEPLPLDAVPLTESLADCYRRVEPLWREELAPLVASGANVLVVGHANCLRALIKCVQGVDDAELPTLAVPNTIPLVYSFAIGGGDADVDEPRGEGWQFAEPKGGRALAPLVPETSDELCYIPPLRANYLGTECKEFEEIDTNHSGEIDAEELKAANICSDDDECQTLIDEADTNATGKIDFKEYVAWERRRDLQKWFEQERKRQEPLPGKSGSKMGSGLGPGSIP